MVSMKKIKAHTLNQIKLVESFDKNDMVLQLVLQVLEKHIPE